VYIDDIIVWGKDIEETLKRVLTTFPVLRLPDFRKRFYVVTDASLMAIGAMLAQIWDNYEHPISYYSKALSRSQR
jgi:hypothetical protein